MSDNVISSPSAAGNVSRCEIAPLGSIGPHVPRVVRKVVEPDAEKWSRDDLLQFARHAAERFDLALYERTALKALVTKLTSIGKMLEGEREREHNVIKKCADGMNQAASLPFVEKFELIQEFHKAVRDGLNEFAAMEWPKVDWPDLAEYVEQPEQCGDNVVPN